MDGAAANGHTAVLAYLHTHWKAVGCTAAGIEAAAANGHYFTVVWLTQHKPAQCYEAKLALLRAAGEKQVDAVFFFLLIFYIV